MIIDLRKTTIALQLRKLLFIVLYVVLIVIFYYNNVFRNGIWGIKGGLIAYSLLALYTLYYTWGIVRNYNYFFYNDMGSKLVFRYYSLAPLSKRNHSVVIPKDQFVKFEILTKAGGLRQYIILYQKSPKGIAKYPPISISLLNSNEKKELRASLSMFQKL